MSGGAFNYLYSKLELPQDDIDDLLRYLKDSGQDLAAMHLEVEFETVTNILDRIRPLVRDVEWWASGDHGDETFQKLFDKWYEQEQKRIASQRDD